MARCPQGHENQDGQAFCGQCGAPILVGALPDVPIEDAAREGSDQLPGVSEEFPAADKFATATTPASRPFPVRRVAIGAGVLVAAVVGFVLFSGDPTIIHGQFQLFDTDVTGDLTDCRGTGGYSDFGPGMPVTVRDGDGKIVGGSATRNAESIDELVELVADDETAAAEDEARELLTGLLGSFVCIVVFEVEVKDAEFYEVEVGRRGKIAYSRAKLEKENWEVGLTLGGS